MLRTKCILAPIEKSDGLRISVMSRHTKDDGVTPDERLTSKVYEEWHMEFAPPTWLVGGYLRGEIEWAEYEREYLAHLREPQRAMRLRQLGRKAQSDNITLMCIEPTPEHCHRRLLAEECQRLVQGLEVQIR